MSNWIDCNLGEVVDLVIDYRGKTPLKLGGNWSATGYRALSAKNIKTGQIVNEDSIRYVDEDLYRKWMKDEVQRGDILITSEAPFGQILFWDSEEKIVLSQRLFCLRLSSKVCPRFVYYYMTTHTFQHELDGRATGTTVIGLRQPELLKCRINLPTYKEQVHIANVLKSLDDKIECNRRINENLEQQAQALFKSWFVDFEPFKDQPFVESELGMIPQKWRVQEAQEVFSINIGKTPPRKESEWFTVSSEDNVWVSIADMGSCGTFISDSSEYLTDEAVKRFNIQMVEKDSILLSFKLTVGRVAIADTRLTTNEAIARFILPEKSYREFLYLYLKQYKYGNLGSTSSIATAVNSKTIKGMKLLIPNAEVIERFNENTRPLFEQIRTIQQESRRLAELRDTLLPKLMSGELKVENVTF